MKAKAIKSKRSFQFLRVNERETKPRTRGLTEIRGPYYSVVGRRYLKDLFEMMGNYVDSLKFAGGSFTLMPNKAVKEIIDLCHKHDVLVSTGGFIERVLAQSPDAVRQYIAECKKLGLEKRVFGAADPDVFAWYIKTDGADANLFVDHSQIVQLECLRAGIWGTKSLWGRVVTYKEPRE